MRYSRSQDKPSPELVLAKRKLARAERKLATIARRRERARRDGVARGVVDGMKQVAEDFFTEMGGD